MIAFAALLRRLFGRTTRTTMPRFTVMMPVVVYEGEAERTSFQMKFVIEAPTKHAAVDHLSKSIAWIPRRVRAKTLSASVEEDNPVASLKAVADAMVSELTDGEREVLRSRLPMGWMFTKPGDKEGGK
jgi:hypothetical protein